MHGGDPQWLCGLDHAPPKLRNLSMLNKILAHRPWLVKKEHIRVSGLSLFPNLPLCRTGISDVLIASLFTVYVS